MGTRLIRGRNIERSDTKDSPKVMVVSQTMASTLWRGKDALGQCVRIGSDTVPCTTVVGIAEDIRTSEDFNTDNLQYYYRPVSQTNEQGGGLFVRVRGDAANAGESVRRALQRVMPGASYVTVRPMSEIYGPAIKSWRLGATMFVAFGVLALTLAAIGMYSVIAYNVTQRNHEMGVRVALGAQGRDLARLVVSEGVKLGGVGIIIGAAVAFAAGKWVKPLLFEQSPHDPVIFAVVTLSLLVVAVAASWMPARRASRVDPSIALRAD
jgi:putative ABC transport system permease protein